MLPVSTSAAARAFGAWDAVLRTVLDGAGKVYRRRWTESQVIESIRVLSESGQEMHSAAVARGNSSLWNAATRRFGNWNNALKNAGFDPKNCARYAPPWTQESLIGLIQACASADQPINPKSFPFGVSNAARRIFGSWEGLLTAAGVDPAESWNRRNVWTRSTILIALRDRMANHTIGKCHPHFKATTESGPTPVRLAPRGRACYRKISGESIS